MAMSWPPRGWAATSAPRSSTAAIRERFETSGHPAGLTVINLGGYGGRGSLPGRWRSSDKPASAAGSSPATSKPSMPCSRSPRRASANCSASRRARWRCCWRAWRAGADSRVSSDRRRHVHRSARRRGRRVGGSASESLVRVERDRLRYRTAADRRRRVQRPRGRPPRQHLRRALRDARREPRDRARGEAQRRPRHRQRRPCSSNRTGDEPSSSRPRWSMPSSTIPTPSRRQASFTARPGWS